MTAAGDANFDENPLAGLEQVNAFLESMAYESNDSPHTIRNYRIDLSDFLRWAARNQLDPFALTHRQARRYLGELDAAGYARSTINRRLSAVKGFYRWLNVSGMLDHDPVCALQGPKKPSRLPHPIGVQEMERLLSVYSECDSEGNARERGPKEIRDQAVLELLYACGLRVSEVSGLKMGDINFEQGLVRAFGKGSKERIVPVHQEAVSSMRLYRDEAREELLQGAQSDWFFVSNRGNRYSADAIRKMFKGALAQAGLDASLSPHAMRHTFATDVLAGGADLRSVQEMLGHASLSTTQIYTHVSIDRMSEAHRQAHPRG